MKRIYLDYAASTPLYPEVVEAMKPFYSEIYGNPSSIHQFGQEAKKAIESAREKLAELLSCSPEEIVFTSSGTEADNLALEGIAYAKKNKGNHIITTKIEHHAVLHCLKFLGGQGFEVTHLDVNKDGFVNPEDIRSAIKPSTILVSAMHANNEIGTIQPIKEISKITKEKGVAFHTDAVQTVGHIETNVTKLGVDMLALSAHKLYGPKGIGALYIRKGTKIIPLIHGGAQERGRRASTENVPGIVGLGVAAKIAKDKMQEFAITQTELKNMLIDGILSKIKESSINGSRNDRLPNNVNVSIKYIEGESMLLNLDMEGIAAGTGSACSSGSLDPSHVLMAIGLKHELAHGSLRFSLGRLTTKKDIEYVLEKLPQIVNKLRAMSPLYKGEK
ncbi:cysteine desulfurase NifS [Candidatus Saganbacteria bacterium]|nr:cysteine desulfurase NifS [Candidatus Saganbacteria bacterium]